MKNKDGRIELVRFIASIFIMIGHMGIFCDLSRPFSDVWFYVEMFLMITGYFTAKHFLERINDDFGRPSGSAARYSIAYTVHKFIRFFPYTTPAIFIKYILDGLPLILHHHFGELVHQFEDMPFELLYLSAANTNGTRLFTIWFLSAMFLVFPAFCMFLQIKDKHRIFLISFYFFIFYYLFRYDFGSHHFPNQLIRVFCGMMGGVLVYFFSRTLRQVKLSETMVKWIGVCEIICFLIPVIFAFWNKRILRLDLLCFLVQLILIFSEKTEVPRLSYNFIYHLGSLSMPIYIWHMVIATLLSYISHYFPVWMLVTFYFMGTFIVSVVNMKVVKRKKLISHNSLEKVLKNIFDL